MYSTAAPSDQPVRPLPRSDKAVSAVGTFRQQGRQVRANRPPAEGFPFRSSSLLQVLSGLFFRRAESHAHPMNLLRAPHSASPERYSRRTRSMRSAHRYSSLSTGLWSTNRQRTRPGPSSIAGCSHLHAPIANIPLRGQHSRQRGRRRPGAKPA